MAPLSVSGKNLFTRKNELGGGSGETASSLDIDGLDDIGADIADADLIIIDDGGGGTNRKSAVTRIPTYVFAALGLDEDGFDSNSATKFATQQSIKAYVDAQVTAQDLDATTDSGTIAIDLDSETLTIAGGEGIDTSGSGNTITIAGEDATTSNKGVASFSSDNFAVSSGAVTIKDGGVANDELAGSIANAKLANSSITVADGSSSTAVALGGTITFAGTSNEVEVGESSGTVTIGLPDDVTIAGDLTVNGDTVTVNTSTLSVEDPLILLGNGNGADSVDLGLYAKYTDSGVKYAGLFRDASDSDKWKLFATTGNSHEAPTTTVNTTSGFTLGTLVVDTLEGTIGTASQTNITGVGTISTGTWEASDIAVAHGGTGSSSLTANGVLIGNGTSAITSVDMSTKGHILIGDGSGNPSMLAIGTNNQVLTADSSEATGVKWADAASGGMTAWILEDDDGTEVSISNNEEVKFIGSGITTNWTDTSDGSDGDPFDLTFTIDAAQTGITSILATDVKIGEDDETKVDFETANEIHFYADNAHQIKLVDGALVPATDNDIDLGTSSVEFKDAYFDGTVTADAFAGPINGDLTGTLQTAAQGNVTSLGTLTSLTIDDIAVDGKVITMTGSTDDTAVMTVGTNGTLTIETTDTAAAAANIQITADGTFEVDGSTITLDSAGDIELNAGGNDVAFKAGSATTVTVTNSSNDAVLTVGTQDKDFVVKGDDGGSAITALTLDMSEAGAASFNSTVTATGFIIGSADIAEAELEMIDGITAGTAAASKAVVLDSNKDIGTIRNITSNGTIQFGSISDGTITATAFVDEDDMSSDSATLIPTQQSVKAYVDNNSSMGSGFVIEDDDGTEVTITESKEMKIIGSGVTTNWTDVDNGTDGDPYDLTITVDAAQTGITSIYATDLIMGEDSQTAIDFGTANEIDFKVDNAARLTLTASALYPVTDNQIDLGTSSLEFKDAFFDGTVTADAFAGPLTGDVTGNVSGTAATVTGAAQSNITSLGTLSALTVDDVAVDGKVITMTGSTDDTAVMTVGTNGTLTIETTDTAAAAANIQITADGTAELAGTTVTLDSGGAVVLDSATGIVNIQDGGSTVLSFTEGNSGDVTVKLETNAKDLVFTDNGDATNMKILDAAAGINVPGEVQTTGIAFTDGDNAMTIVDGGAVTFPVSIDITGSAGIILENDETITNSTNGQVDINGNVMVGSGSGNATVKSSGNHDIIVQTGNSTTGSITITDGANGDITLAPNGTGEIAADSHISVADSHYIELESAAGTPGTDDSAQGIVIEFLAAEAITQWDAVYVSTTTGRVGRADANDAAKMPVIGIAIEAQGSAGSAVRVLTHGVYRDDGGFGGNMTVGVDLYAPETPGNLTTTRPSDDDDFVQVIGVAIGVRSAFINPDLTVLKLD